MFKDFLENRIVDIKENLIMSSLQSDLDNSINKGDECTESVPNIMPLCLFLVHELKRDLRDLTERVSILEKGTEKCTNNIASEHIDRKVVKRIYKRKLKVDQMEFVKNNKGAVFKEREEWYRRRGCALEKIREIYMQLARLNMELDGLC